jgi:sugar-specific transcriptional regulator TrmB
MYTNTIKQFLSKFEIDSPSSLIFELLLTHNELKVSEISKLTKLNRTSCYKYIEILEKNKLVQSYKKNGITRVFLENLDRIHLNFENRVEETYRSSMNQIDHFSKIISHLNQNKSQFHEPEVLFFKGNNALKDIYDLSFNTKKMVAYFDPWTDHTNASIDEWHKNERMRRQIPIRILVPDSLHGREFAKVKAKYKRSKLCDKLNFSGMKLVTDDQILNYSDPEKMGVCIKSKFLAQNELAIFDKIWNEN